MESHTLKKLFLLIVLGLPACAAVALVAHTGTTSATTTSITTTGATLIVVNVSSFQNCGGSQDVLSDSKGNTWTQLALDGSVTGQSDVLYYSANPTVGTLHTFTLTNPCAASITVAAFSGVATPTFASVSSFSEGNGSTGAPGLMTPAAPNSLLITGAAINSPQTFSSIDNSFTITDSATAGGHIGGALGYLIQSGGPTNVTPTWTFSGSTAHQVLGAIFVATGETVVTTPAPVSNSAKFSAGNLSTAQLNITGATLLLINVGSFQSIDSISDTAGNTWSALTSQNNSTTYQKIWYVINPTTTANDVITVNTSGNNTTAVVAAFIGTDTFVGSAGSSGSSNNFQAGSVSPAVANSLAIAGFSTNVQTFSSVDGSFTLLRQFTSGSIIGDGVAYLVTGGAVNPTWTLSGSQQWGATNAVFNPTVIPTTYVSNPSVILVP